MKKYFKVFAILCFLALGLSISSCSEDDEKDCITCQGQKVCEDDYEKYTNGVDMTWEEYKSFVKEFSGCE